VDLQRNQISDDGACSLADALESNISILATLELEFNAVSEVVQQRVNDILAGPRTSKKKQANRKSSLFWKASSTGCRWLWQHKCITDVHMMKFYYTTVAMLRRLDVMSKEDASSYIQMGLDRASSTCSPWGEAISCSSSYIEKAEGDGYIQRFDLYRFDNKAEVKRMESASFIADLQQAVTSNTARVEGLEANVAAINHSVNTIKDGIKRQMKIEAAVGFLCAKLNAISFGVGGSILDASINALQSVVE